MTTPAAATTRPDGSRLYAIPDPDTGEVVELPNISSILDVMHSFGLDTWRRRNLLIGCALREDITCQVVAAHHHPDPKVRASELKRLASAAIDAGVLIERGMLASDFGSGIHALTECIDAGTVDGYTVLPAGLAGWRDGYLARMRGVEVVETEFTVFGAGYAGTGDRIVRFDTEALGVEGVEVDGAWARLDEGCYVVDVKTGRVHEKAAMQLAALAGAYSIWDAEAQTHRPLPADLSPALGFVLDCKADRAELIPVDLRKARTAFFGALAVKAFADTKPLGQALPKAAAGAGDTRSPAPAALVTRPDACDDTAGGAATCEGAEPTRRPPGRVDTPPAVDAGEDIFAGLPDETGRPQIDRAAKRRWLIGRLQALDDTGRAAVASRWPPGVPTFRDVDIHSTEQLAAIEEAIMAGEADVGAPFPDETDPALTPVAADDPRVTDLRARWRRLPPALVVPLVAGLRAHQVPSIDAPRLTEADLAAITAALEETEAARAVRAQEIADAFGIAAEHGVSVSALLDWLNVDDITLIGPVEETRLQLLVDAVALGDVTEHNHHLVVDQPSGILTRFGGRANLLAVARREAARHRLPAPRNSDEVLANPLLVAAVVCT